MKIQFPHCDSRVLHAEGVCNICDTYAKELQAVRRAWNMNFTGESSPNRLEDPATKFRGLDSVNKWHGNVSSTAYLVAKLEISKNAPFPLFTEAGIYSSPASGLTTFNGEIMLDSAQMKGTDYNEAHNKLIEFINESPWLEWARVWVSENPEAVAKREQYRELMRSLSPKLTGLLLLK